MTLINTNKIAKIIPLVLLCAGAIGLSGCESLRRAAGGEKVTPDEFRVVTKAPLVIPPEYNLRPPRPGEARPLELRADMQAKSAIFGVQLGTDASSGEKELIYKMGAQNADPRIRAILDEETGKIAHKPEKFADKILNFGKTPVDVNGSAPLDATSEVERLEEKGAIENTTGGKDVKIQQNAPKGFKLPGL